MKYVVAVKSSKAKGLVAKVYSQIKNDFGRIVEPFTLHSPIPTLLAGVWMASRESELVGNVSRKIKEAVAASVSKINHCPYCVDAHTIMIRATGEKKTAQLISQEHYQKINPLRTRKIVNWALSTLSPDSKEISFPPFEAEDAPEIIGTAIFYHYINPMVTIFLGNSPIPVPFFKSQMKYVASNILFKKAVKRPKTSGTALPLLPSKELPADFSWAKDSPNVSGAYARLAEVIKDLEKTFVPKQTQETIKQYLNDWKPQSSGFGLEWLNEETLNMEVQSKTATTLALLTILSPYRITKEFIDNFRSAFPQQNQLLGIAAWASFTKARKIGTWLNDK